MPRPESAAFVLPWQQRAYDGKVNKNCFFRKILTLVSSRKRQLYTSWDRPKNTPKW